MATTRSRKKPAAKSGGKASKQSMSTTTTEGTMTQPATKPGHRSGRRSKSKLQATKGSTERAASGGSITVELPALNTSVSLTSQQAAPMVRFALAHAWKQPATKSAPSVGSGSTKSRSRKPARPATKSSGAELGASTGSGIEQPATA